MNEENQSNSLDILLLAEDFYPKTSGGAFTDWNFSRLSAKRGHHVTVYTPRTSETAARETVEEVEIHRPYRATPTLRHPNSAIGVLYRLSFLLLLTARLVYEVRSNQYDMIYSTNHLLHPTAKLLGLLFGLPVVNFVGYSPSERTDLRMLDFRNIFEFVIFSLCMGQVVLCRTPQVRNRIEELSRSEVQLVHGLIDQSAVTEAAAVDIDSARGKFGIRDEEQMLVSVCRLVPVKQPEAAVRVLSDLPESYHLLIIGDGDLRSSVERIISACGVEDRVNLLGYRPHDETLQLIAAADGLLLTSSVEAYPTVVFEALALSTSVFSTSVGILPEIDNSNLHLCSLDLMSETIRKIQYGSKNGLDEDAAYRFSIERFTETVLNVMEIAIEDSQQEE